MKRQTVNSYDHLLLVRRHPVEVARLLAAVNRVEDLLLLKVMHESNDSCCLAEPWPTTFTRLLASRRDE